MPSDCVDRAISSGELACSLNALQHVPPQRQRQERRGDAESYEERDQRRIETMLDGDDRGADYSSRGAWAVKIAEPRSEKIGMVGCRYGSGMPDENSLDARAPRAAGPVLPLC